MLLDDYPTASAANDHVQSRSDNKTPREKIITSPTSDGNANIIDTISSTSRGSNVDDDSDIENDVQAALLILAEMEENDQQRKGATNCLGLSKEARSVHVLKENSPNTSTKTNEASADSAINFLGDFDGRNPANPYSFSRNQIRPNLISEESCDDDDTKRALEIFAEMEKNETLRESSCDSYDNTLTKQKSIIPAPQMSCASSLSTAAIKSDIISDTNQPSSKAMGDRKLFVEMKKADKPDDVLLLSKQKSNETFQNPTNESCISTEMNMYTNQLSNDADSADADIDTKRALQILAEMEVDSHNNGEIANTENCAIFKVDSLSYISSRNKPHYNSYFDETDNGAQRAVQLLTEMEESGCNKKTAEAENGLASKVDLPNYALFIDMLCSNTYSDETEADAQRALELLAEMEEYEKSSEPSSRDLRISEEARSTCARARAYISADKISDESAHHSDVGMQAAMEEKAPVVVIEAKDSAASMTNPPQLSATDIDDDDMCAFQLLINMSPSSTCSEENEEDSAYALKILAEMERNENKLHAFTATGSNDTFCSERQAVLSNTLSASNRQIREGIAYSPGEKSSDVSANHSDWYLGMQAAMKEKEPVVVIEAKDSAASMTNPPQLSATDIADDGMCAFQLLNNMSPSSTYSEENEEDAAYALKILAEMERIEKKPHAFTVTGSNDTFCSERQAALSNTLSASNRQIKEGIAYSSAEKSSDVLAHHSDVRMQAAMKEKEPVVDIEAKDSAASMINPPQLSATDIDDDDMCAFQLLINMSASSTYSEENEEDAAYALKILAEMERNENKLSTFTATGSNDTFCSDSQAVLSNNISASNVQVDETMVHAANTRSNSENQGMVSNSMSNLYANTLIMTEKNNNSEPVYDLMSLVENTDRNDNSKVQSKSNEAKLDANSIFSDESTLRSSVRRSNEIVSTFHPETQLLTPADANIGNFIEGEKILKATVLLNPNSTFINSNNVNRDDQSSEQIANAVKSIDGVYAAKELPDNEVMVRPDLNSERNISSSIAHPQNVVCFRNPFSVLPNPPQPRNALEIIGSYSAPTEPVKVSCCKPSSSILQLISAVRGASSSRRCNACGTFKMLTSNDKNKSTLARTEGVLDAFRFIIELKSSVPCQDTMISRLRVMSAVHNLATRADNRALIVHSGLMPGLVNVVKNDGAEGRVIACSILAHLAKSDSNQLQLIHTPDLVTVLSHVLAATASGMEVLRKDQNAENTVEENLTDEDDSDDNDTNLSLTSTVDSFTPSDAPVAKGDKYAPQRMTDQQISTFLNPARLSACAAFMHLSKDCACTSEMCKNKIFLKSLAQVCAESDFEARAKSIEILCNLTRLPSNQKLLSSNENIIQSLTACLKSSLADDRKWAARALQNICSDQNSKVLIAKQPLLKALGLSALSQEADEQFASVAALLNLSCEPGVVTAMSNTKNVVSTLIHITYDTSSPAQVRLMACDALASIGLWLQTVASSTTVPDGMESNLPSYITSGWERYD